ncbi:MAG: DHHW family protein [Bacteroidales bacterium]|nr:DHHW family protein [Bacteroidales bacterium]
MLSSSKIYLIIAGGAFGLATVVLNFFPRSTVSERERRNLATFPKFSTERLMSGEYADSISKWYSDSEPFRDFFLNTNDNMKRARGYHSDDEVNMISDVTFAPEIIDQGPTTEPAAAEPNEADSLAAASDQEKESADTIGQNYKPASNGILILGKEPNAKAMFGFTSTSAYVESYASAANAYKAAFPEAHVWVMPVPTAVEFYCPEQAKGRMVNQKAIIDKTFGYLEPGVTGVDIWQTLYDHRDEHIYLHTDHHWSPLGGFYAAQKLCEMAGLPAPGISEGYEVRTVHGFVGSLYAYCSDAAIKNSPEDFVWYFPKVDFETQYIVYTLDDERHITKASNWQKGNYFCIFKDGNGGAYCTFMGSDSRITKVVTSQKNGRRILIMKDSFGNTVPSCLFHSFEEVHVVDYRYFNKNMRQYAAEHKITDFLFCNNMNFVTNPQIGRIYKRFLDQGEYVHKEEKKESEAVADPMSTASPTPADSPASDNNAEADTEKNEQAQEAEKQTNQPADSL